MAKAPRAGQSKTRLTPRLSPEQAAQMSAAFLGDVTANLALASGQTGGAIVAYIAYAPAGAAASFDGIVAPGTRLLLADGTTAPAAGVAGFGACLLHAIRALLEDGHSAACVLNSDSPNLPTGVLLAAHAALAAPGDAIVMGAAEDGGYYLLGMKQAHAALFAHIDWSTDRVAAQTRARAAQAGLDVIELDTWYDVDEPAALDRLLDDLAAAHGAGAYAAPRTAACVERLGLTGGSAIGASAPVSGALP
jgi:rSAM/selenodomain-associated transferase 1